MTSTQTAQVLLIFIVYSFSTGLAFTLPTDDSECGGLVTVKAGENVTLTYKETTDYENLERCTWALLPEEGVTLSSITIIYESQGFSPLDDDGLTFYSWTDTGNFVGDRVPANIFGTSKTYETSQGFLFWTSNSQGTGQGFRLIVNGVENQNGTIMSGGRNVAGAHGEIGQVYQIEYPPFPLTEYPNEARLGIVFRHEPINSEPSHFKIDYLDTEEGSDELQLFGLTPFHAKDDPPAYFISSYSGQHQTGIPDTVTASENLIGLFSSDESGSGRGFSIKWS